MIRLINYPYGKYKVGDEVDLGEEKNRDMVALGRAVFVGKDAEKWNPIVVAPPPPKPAKPSKKEEEKTGAKDVRPTETAPVSRNKPKTSKAADESTGKPKSFWDRLK